MEQLSSKEQEGELGEPRLEEEGYGWWGEDGLWSSPSLRWVAPSHDTIFQEAV